MTPETKNTLISFTIDFVCGAISALAVLLSIKLLIKWGLGQLVVMLLVMIPAVLLGTKLSEWVHKMRLNKI